MTNYVRIGLDPTSEVEGHPALYGAKRALEEDKCIEIVIPGDAAEIKEFCAKHSLERLIAANTTKKSKGAALRVLTELSNKQEIDAIVTANNTKLVMASVKKGIGMCTEEFENPPIIIPLPWVKMVNGKYATGFSYLLDAGANMSYTPQNLRDFAIMARLYVQHVLGVSEPTIALVDVDEKVEYMDLEAEANKELVRHFLQNYLGVIGSSGKMQDAAEAEFNLVSIPWIRSAGTEKDPAYDTGKAYFVKPKADAVCTPRYLVELAKKAIEQVQRTKGIKEPTIALVNIGEESNKGRALELEAYKLFEAEFGKNFKKNAEPYPLFNGHADIYITDSFSARMILSMKETLVDKLIQHVEKGVQDSNGIIQYAKRKLGKALLNGLFDELKKSFNPDSRKNQSVEALFGGYADIFVTNGFIGNIILKEGEALVNKLFQFVKKGIYHDPSFVRKNKRKIGGYLLKDMFYDLKATFDSSSYGGAPLLGLNTCVIKCHGRSNETAFYNATKNAAQYARADLINKMKEEFSLARAN